MESWIISLVIAISSIVGTFAVIRYMVGELKRNEQTIFRRLDKHGDDIVKLNTQSELAMTAKDVDDKYVSKELFRQFEKHMDKRFDSLEGKQDEILRYIKEGK